MNTNTHRVDVPITTTEQKYKTTLFAHVLNEEIALPCWLTHHSKHFSHGVMLDCGSTDKSVEIITRLCPTWEIMRLKDVAGGRDHQDIAGALMMELESRHTGWKCVLNVSEYLMVGDLQAYISKMEATTTDKVGVRATGIIIVDRPGETDLKQFIDNTDWIYKKDFGYIEEGKAWSGHVMVGHDDPDKVDANGKPVRQYTFPVDPITTCRNRLLHKALHGHYTNGRHNTNLNNIEIDRLGLFVVWVGRGSPELYHHRSLSWHEQEQKNGCTVFPPNSFTLMADVDVAMQFWRNEVTKSSLLAKENAEYKAVMDLERNVTPTL